MIIDRYIYREIFYSLMAVTAVLYLVYLANRFVRFLAEAAGGALPGDVLIILLSLKSLSSLVILIPLALYLAIFLVLGRLYKDNEIIAMTACGIGMNRIFRDIVLFATVFAGLVAVMALYVAPWAEEQSYRIQDEARASAELTALVAGKFKEIHGRDGIFYAEKVGAKGRTMVDMFVQWREGDKLNTLTAASAQLQIDRQTGDRMLVMKDGYRYEGSPGSADFKIIQYRKHGIRIEAQDVEPTRRKLWALSTKQLWQRAWLADRAELQRRISMPLATVLLAMLAVPLSRTGRRQGRYAKLFVAILAYVIYNNMLGVAQSWVEHGVVPPAIGMWWVHIVFFAFLTALLVRQRYVRWRWWRQRSPLRA